MKKAIFIFFVGLLALVQTQSVSARGFPDFTQLVEDIQPSVVSIKVDVRKRGRGIGKAGGSGFVIDSDGYILTNHHVVDKSDRVTVKLSNGRSFPAEIIGSDLYTDVALLKIDAKGQKLTPLKLGKSSSLKVGEWVLAFGAPFNLEQTVTAGIVSAKGRGGVGSPFVPFIQTDVAINSGNSGGPLVNLDGEVVGINSMIYNPMIATGLSFSIPMDLAKSISEQLKDSGAVTRGYLGVQYKAVNQEIADYFELDQVAGALINYVQKDSPADKAGIKRGDIITKIAGNTIKREQDLHYFIAQVAPGETIELEGFRDGKSKDFKAKLVARDDDLPSSNAPSSDEDRLGVEVKDLTQSIKQQIGFDEGVLVVQVKPGSPAQRAGLKRGDVISEVNRNNVKSVRDYNRVMRGLKSTKKMLLLVSNASGSDYRIVYLDR